MNNGELRKLIRFISVIFIMFAPQARATVSGFDLLKACEVSLHSHNGGIQDQLCEYYITPCDCDLGENRKHPRVCLPDGKTMDELAGIVIDGLKKSPDLLQVYAGTAAATVLAKVYPCNTD